MEHLKPSELVKRGLEITELNGLFAYIKFGLELENFYRPSFSSKQVWFDLGILLRPLIMFPEVYGGILCNASSAALFSP